MPFIGNFGPGELIIVLVIALVVLGPGKLPEVGAALGKSIREFRKAATDIKDATSLEPLKTDAAPAPAAVVAPVAAAPVAPVPVAAAPVAPAPAAAEPAATPGPEAPAS